MSDELKQLAIDVINSPKAQIGVAAFFSSTFWIDWGEPTVNGIGKILGLVILVLMVIKHYRALKNDLDK